MTHQLSISDDQHVFRTSRRDRVVFLASFMIPVVIVKPVFDMYWEESLLGVNLNWLPYAWIVAGILVCHRALLVNRVGSTLIACVLGCVAVQIITEHSFASGSALRTLLSLIPLAIVVAAVKRPPPPFGVVEQRPSTNDWRRGLIPFAILYGLFLLPNLVVVVQQVLGLAPVRDFDTINEVVIPRYSGAYLKPNNLAFSWLPLFILSLCLLRDERGKVGVKLVAGSLALAIGALAVWLIGLRTFDAILLICVAIFMLDRRQLAWAKRMTSMAVVAYPLILLATFAIFGKFLDESLLRGRTDAWSEHLRAYLSWSPRDQLLGKGRVALSPEVGMGAFSEEFHNDYGRILITHGLLGLLLSIAVVRAYVLCMFTMLRDNHVLMRAHVSGIVALMMYSTTNEPTYYPAVFWSFLVIPLLAAGYGYGRARHPALGIAGSQQSERAKETVLTVARQ